MDARAGLDDFEKATKMYLPLWQFKPRTVQPEAQSLHPQLYPSSLLDAFVVKCSVNIFSKFFIIWYFSRAT